ncbi:threo-3-hydroxy-L-aspartate ammonia-lyase [Williamsia deligens]|uniref:Threo-3-hydroxy-L-aspartate ammonia-lyase n=1 Tax=Williamsia deligens TaxID=321325 RepID=A0ABW3GC56_9NOCA|nr:threo-3-hydroxy-L-aspartate ammonia-lyase [Williamsia deligens]MCP2192854.1 threonine dehydratase [Williamsia deligens]
MDRAPSYDSVAAAAATLDGVAHRTPVVTSRLLDEIVGARLFLKCENLQRAGAFKFRGAYTAVSRLPAERRRAGVLAYSSGNHAQGLSLAAQLHDVPATIVMPHDAPPPKVAATQAYGATVVRYDRYSQDRVAVAAEIAERTGASIIPPFDHPDVIAGQGTAVAELLIDVDDLDVLLVPLGGGGLLSGSLLSVGALSPSTEVFGVEPAAGDDALQSLRAGHIVEIPTPRTIADGAQTTRLGDRTFPIIREHVTDILTADDDALRHAMGLLATRAKLVVEPTGALSLAAAIGHRDRFAGARVGVVVSGGNVDTALFATAG